MNAQMISRQETQTAKHNPCSQKCSLKVVHKSQNFAIIQKHLNCFLITDILYKLVEVWVCYLE